MEYNDSEFNLNNILIKIDASTKSKYRHLSFVWIVYIYLINQARGPYWENIGPRPCRSDRAQRGLYKKDRGLIFSRYGPEQAWLIRDLLHD